LNTGKGGKTNPILREKISKKRRDMVKKKKRTRPSQENKWTNVKNSKDGTNWGIANYSTPNKGKVVGQDKKKKVIKQKQKTERGKEADHRGGESHQNGDGLVDGSDCAPKGKVGREGREFGILQRGNPGQRNWVSES